MSVTKPDPRIRCASSRRLHNRPHHHKSLGGKDELSNLRALCSTCNQGAKNVTSEKPSRIWLLSQIRRAGLDEQRAVFDWLQKKFEPAEKANPKGLNPV